MQLRRIITIAIASRNSKSLYIMYDHTLAEGLRVIRLMPSSLGDSLSCPLKTLNEAASLHSRQPLWSSHNYFYCFFKGHSSNSQAFLLGNYTSLSVSLFVLGSVFILGKSLGHFMSAISLCLSLYLFGGHMYLVVLHISTFLYIEIVSYFSYREF